MRTNPPAPKLAVIWEPCEQPDNADLLLLFDMLFPPPASDLTKRVDTVSCKHPQDP